MRWWNPVQIQGQRLTAGLTRQNSIAVIHAGYKPQVARPLPALDRGAPVQRTTARSLSDPAPALATFGCGRTNSKLVGRTGETEVPVRREAQKLTLP